MSIEWLDSDRAYSVIIITQPFGGYFHARFQRRAHAGFRPFSGQSSGAFIALAVSTRRRAALVTMAWRCTCFSVAGFLSLYALQRFRAFFRSTARFFGRRGGSRLQHGDELCHQHQLAILRPRDHHELPRADGGDGAQFCLGRDGDRACGRAGAWFRAVAVSIGNFWSI
jgi:hypothetical protein